MLRQTPSTTTVTTPLISLLRRSRRVFYQLLCSKTILLLLLWDFSTNNIFNLYINPFIFLKGEIKNGELIVHQAVVAAIFLFTPLAGLLADIKFTRFKALICSTYAMLISGLFICTIFIILIILASMVHSVNHYIILTLFLPLYLALLVYSSGRMCFVANILQFVMDQLHDQPTRNSVFFLYVYFFSSNFCSLVAISTSIPSNTGLINYNGFTLNTWKLVAYFIVISLSIILMTFSLIMAYKKRLSWFVTERVINNPCKLVYKVLYFAWLHKKPIRHPSAFVYCENEQPCRMDFGKTRYGGPFTTEQVEDVKVVLRILTVLAALGPTFLLQQGVLTSVLHHHVHSRYHYWENRTELAIFLKHGAMSPLLTMMYIPIYLLLINPWFERWVPNMLKRMGLSVIVACLSFMILLISDSLAYSHEESLDSLSSNICRVQEDNITYILNRNLITFPSVCMLTLQHALTSLQQLLLYVSSLEFISCQSPQHMKGFMFGLFYAIKAFNELMAAILLVPFVGYWKTSIITCQSTFFLVNLGIGGMTVVVYTVVAKKYKYRKRDDICNYYQFAENYYSR